MRRRRQWFEHRSEGRKCEDRALAPIGLPSNDVALPESGPNNEIEEFVASIERLLAEKRTSLLTGPSRIAYNARPWRTSSAG